MIFKYLLPAIIAIVFGAADVHASLSIQELADKSDKQLMELLGDGDNMTQLRALLTLRLRFCDPKKSIVNAPISVEIRPARVPLPVGLLEKTAALASDDGDSGVRLEAVIALESFKFRTNTSPILESLLTNSSCEVRIRAASALIAFNQMYREKVPDKVLPMLIQCLGLTNSPVCAAEATVSLGNMGAKAQDALPILRTLATNDLQVRPYAAKAIAKIEQSTNSSH